MLSLLILCLCFRYNIIFFSPKKEGEKMYYRAAYYKVGLNQAVGKTQFLLVISAWEHVQVCFCFPG